MYVIHEEECHLSFESVVQSALASADVVADLEDLAPVEPAGWARRAYAANGFGAATLAPENDEDPAE